MAELYWSYLFRRQYYNRTQMYQHTSQNLFIFDLSSEMLTQSQSPSQLPPPSPLRSVSDITWIVIENIHSITIQEMSEGPEWWRGWGGGWRGDWELQNPAFDIFIALCRLGQLRISSIKIEEHSIYRETTCFTAILMLKQFLLRPTQMLFLHKRSQALTPVWPSSG